MRALGSCTCCPCLNTALNNRASFSVLLSNRPKVILTVAERNNTSQKESYTARHLEGMTDKFAIIMLLSRPKTASVKKYKSHSSKAFRLKNDKRPESTCSACHRSTACSKQTWQVLATRYEHLKQLLLRSSTYKYEYKYSLLLG